MEERAQLGERSQRAPLGWKHAREAVVPKHLHKIVSDENAGMHGYQLSHAPDHARGVWQHLLPRSLTFRNPAKQNRIESLPPYSGCLAAS